MKRIFTLLLGLAAFCLRPQAQYSQDFETANVLGVNCLDQTQFIPTIGSSVSPIHGLGSAYTNPPTSGTEIRSLTTPYLVLTGDPLTISFYYMISNKLNGNATRVITVGLVDRYGVFSPLDQISMDKFSDVGEQFFNRTFTGIAPGVQRVEFRISGNTGDGNSRMIYDDLYVSASPYYGPVVNCNTPPQVVNDNYFPAVIEPVSGNVVSGEAGADSDVNGEALVATLASPPADSLGAVVFNADGTFTFTPAPGFTGGLVTFTYRVTDDGYPAATSAVATVTISYLISTLPVQITGFGGRLVGGKAELSWSVAGNEASHSFVVERSTDGRTFTAAGRVAATKISGAESYSFTDRVSVAGKAFYRLRVVERLGDKEVSRVLLLETGALAGPSLRVLFSPGSTGLSATYTAVQEGQVVLRVFNMAGQCLYTSTGAVKSGVNQLTISSPALEKGQVYVLEVTGGGQRSTVKFWSGGT